MVAVNGHAETCDAVHDPNVTDCEWECGPDLGTVKTLRALGMDRIAARLEWFERWWWNLNRDDAAARHWPPKGD